jgi:hypothetical protein
MLALISFDATSRPMLDRMIAEGRLPHLAALRQESRLCAFESTPFFASAYPSLCTGVGPANHGVYYPFQWSPAEQRVCLAEDLLPADSVFERAARAGKRVCVIDPTDCSPRQFASGLAISGWQFESRLFRPRWSRPRAALRMLSADHGRAVKWSEVFGASSEARMQSLREILVAAPGRVAAAVETLMRRERIDLLWVNFVAIHLAGHRFWDRPQVLEQTIEAADAALGRVLAALPDGAAIVVFSPKAMGPNTSRVELLPEMLARVLGGKPEHERRPFRQSTLSRVRAALPAQWRETVAALMPDRLALDLTARLETLRIDWQKTRAFALPSDGAGFVRVNRKGREVRGIVEPGEADRMLNEIAAGLLTFHDIGGGPSIRVVTRSSEIVGDGERLDWLPDLVVSWSETPVAGLEGVFSREFGEVRCDGPGFGRSGEHVGETWAVVHPGAHRFTAAEFGTVTPVDLAATICSLSDLPSGARSGLSLLQ